MNELSHILKDIGIKQTKQRLEILSLLKEAQAPLTAEQIYHAVPDQTLSLSTVYRTLEMFSEKGITKKSNLLDSDKYYYELISCHHRDYAVCLACREMRYVDVCPVHDIKVGDFTITGHKLELYGYCEKCRKTNI